MVDAVSAVPKVFVDTHVLLLADDQHQPDKQQRVRAWMQVLWQRRLGRVSTQVLNAYYVYATRDFGMPVGDARAKIRRLQLWRPWQIDHQTVETAWGIEARFGLLYEDALVVAAAAQSGCRYVLTTQLPHDQHIDGTRLIDPLALEPSALGLGLS